MALRQPLPRLWLMTDERIGAALWPALVRLPRGSGVIFRHHATPAAERRRLFDAVKRIARQRRLTLVLAGNPRQAIAWRADGAHGRSRHVHAPRTLVRTTSAHDRRDLIAAKRAGAHLVLLSPVFPTRSHPGQKSLGVIRFGLAAGSQSKRRGLNRVHYWPSPQPKLGSRACGGRSRPPEIPACAGMTGLSGGSDLKLANPGGPHIIALGGMTSRRFDRLRALGAYGWAAIDGLTHRSDQNLKVVPR